MENITCQFCYQFFDEPVLLQCKHPICSNCAQMQFSFELLRKPCDHFPLKTEHKQKEGKEKAHDEKKTVDICCPQCNEKTSLIVTQGITKLTRDGDLVERVKKIQEPKELMCCEGDGVKATLYCEDCKENYCKECFYTHHSVATRKNHHATEIDGKSPPNKSEPPTTCSKHGHPLNMFCQRDQVACCHQCFEIGEHKEHESTSVSHVTEKNKKEIGGKLVGIDEQINKIRQAISKMTNLKEQVTLSHMQFEKQVEEGFDHIIAQLAKKKDALVDESKKMRGTTLSNITLQQEALGDLLKQKTDMVEQTNKWLSGSDLQVAQCKQLLQRNQEIIASMLICCESGKISTVDLSPVEQVIDKLGSIVKIPVDMKLPTISGLKECQQDKESVTIQWDPVKCDFPEMYFAVQTRADNDDTTVKNFKIPSNVTSLQMPVAENWNQLVCTVRCEIDEQFQGEKCVPLTVDLFANGLHNLKEKCSQKIYERVHQAFNQKGNKLDLNGCNIDDTCAIAVARMLPHFTQLQLLYLYDNQIGSTGATPLANSITNLTQLRVLNLSDNQIGDIGATALGDSITNLTQLQGLSLNDNQIGDTGAIVIANSIGKLTRLNYLYIQNNNINKPVKQQLKKQFGAKLYIYDYNN